MDQVVKTKQPPRREHLLAMLDAFERNYGGAKPAAATATPQSKAQRANAIAAQNPGWTREQVIEAVNRETSR